MAERAVRPIRKPITIEEGDVPMQLLDGKVAIVAGASSGMGAATARLFAAQGAAVVLGRGLRAR